MKASELIDLLKKMIEKYGDHEICASYDTGYGATGIDEVIFDKERFNKPMFYTHDFED